MKLDGDSYVRASMNKSGEILPLELELRTYSQNGLLLHALHANNVSLLIGLCGIDSPVFFQKVIC